MDHDEVPGEPLPPTLVPRHPTPLRFGDPTQIGRYRVIRLLGRGGFGRVYLAHDDELDRPVAIKVPNPERVSLPGDLEAYLTEAKILARLEHPNIVPVHDAGRTDDGLCYVVSKFLEGSDLATKLRNGRRGFRESAELIAMVAEALHYAHTRGLVHRDIKPANILIDVSGQPCVADFGLALRDEDFGRGAGIAGTPAYMSPEQSRGEAHRVDGRSDIFSLGVVFYEMLTARRPFIAESRRELLDLIAKADPRPPRQIDDTIPKELERICFKALSKRASERYTTARDMAEDLRHFLQTTGELVVPAMNPAAVGPPSGSTQTATPVPTTSKPSDSDQRPLKIVPKGLRSFDEQDADFFLELLPGPRDRDGLPDSIRFWKTLIERTDPDKTFRVGLIYGPSGCGKSSLVKAGLLPRLERNVLSVYVEATPEETEARLLKALRKACPDLPSGMGLVDSLVVVRQGRMLRSGQKVLLVIDQFEQWLHARRGQENTEFVAALRQCDGEHLQAIVMVRDDFWMAATRFMDALEVELKKGQNTAAVDLFDFRHATKVLTAFGTAYGNLPERTGDVSRDQQAFLDQTIAELAQDGKVVSVRLALFAEMVKGKPWTPAALRDVGGTEGVGVTFLEETFSSNQANPKHRLHQRAAQAALKALLPESGSDIKGQMRSEPELQNATGYSDRPRDFADLMHVLDGELRLITPTDPEGTSGESQPTGTQGGRYYQLTHDYLVPSLRDWLTRKQRETRRGRAELRLAERSSLWNARPENRHLPSPLEWANIKVLTRSRAWTERERRMMKRAAWVHGLRSFAGLILVGLLAWGGVEGYGILRASALVESLRTASTADVAQIVKQIASYRRWADSRLARLLEDSEPATREHLHASLALLPVDPRQADYLSERLLTVSPGDVSVLRQALRPHRGSVTPRLWDVVATAKPDDARLLPAASALALLDPKNDRWKQAGVAVSDALVGVNAMSLGGWTELLRPVRQALTPSLASIFRDAGRSESERRLATNVLFDYAGDEPNLVADLLMVADPKPYSILFPIAQRQASRFVPLFEAEVAKQATYQWNDPPLDASWTEPDRAVTSRIESAQGLLHDRFAFCQTMPLDEFLTTVEALSKSGYRPVRFRPFADGQAVKVAAVWARDGRSWRLGSGLTPEQVRQQDEAFRTVRGGSPDPAESPVRRGSPDPAESPVRRGSPDPAVPPPVRRGSPDPAVPLTEGLPSMFLPVDVAGYVETDKDGKPIDRYAAIWVEKTRPEEEAQVEVGTNDVEHQATQNRLKAGGMTPLTLQAIRATDGRTRFCGVWRKSGTSEVPPAREDLDETKLGGELAQNAGGTLTDLCVAPAVPPPSPKERATANVKAAETAIKAKPDDPIARFSRAIANYQLGKDPEAIDDLNVVIQKAPQAAVVLQYRAMAHARLHHKKEALDDLAGFEKGDGTASSKLYLATVVAVELGESLADAFGKLEAALKEQPRDSGLNYDAACAYSLASQALYRTDPAKSRELSGRAIQLLKAAIQNGYSDFGHMQEDADLDPIRDVPAFAEIVKGGDLDRRYAAVWASGARHDVTPVYGLDSAAQLKRCRELESQGYRIRSVSLVRTRPEGPLVTASVWHRPAVSEDVKDELAKRQARAAIALVKLGKAEEVWPFMRHSPDPRLRSFMVNWLNPLGADPKLIAAELDRLDSTTTRKMDGVGRGSPDPAQGTEVVGRGSPDPAQGVVGRGSPDPAQGTDRRSPASGVAADSGRPSVPGRAGSGDPRPTLRPSVPGTAATLRVPAGPRPEAGESRPTLPNAMDGILFHPETSLRRALILALGTYGADGLSPGERERLLSKLLDLYRNDPDAGIHGAADWTLRQWRKQDKLKASAAELAKVKQWDDRRWYLNGQGQTFAIVEGPVEFRMGSPATEPDHDPREIPHRRIIHRRFAIADKEVSVEQFQRFVRENPQFGLDRSYLDKYSPEPDGPMIAVDWYGAAAYCNWLSEQEGLPKDQWCYLRNKAEAYAEGMTIPADVLARTGYRLPTEAEWEYACRSGAMTSRYFGLSTELLGRYARYQANSREHVWPRGSLLPNDLGLSDMLGNVVEWCQDPASFYQWGKEGSVIDRINTLESISQKNSRLLRGGAFLDQASNARSALRYWNQPAYRVNSGGFRPARTYP